MLGFDIQKSAVQFMKIVGSLFVTDDDHIVVRLDEFVNSPSWFVHSGEDDALFHCSRSPRSFASISVYYRFILPQRHLSFNLVFLVHVAPDLLKICGQEFFHQVFFRIPDDRIFGAVKKTEL